MRKILLLTATLQFAFIIQAQKITNQDRRIWLGYLTQTKVSDRLSLWADAHWVNSSFGILRPGLSYHFNNKINLVTTLGYAHLWIYPAAGNKTFRPEHRAWGQTTATQKSGNTNFFQRLRYEARFRQILIEDHLQNEFNFNYRLRYLFQTKYNLTKQPDAKQKFYTLFSDEIACNLGKEIKHKFRLDQNRISVGGGVAFGQVALQLAYVNQLLKSGSSNTFSMNHHLQLLAFHNFDLYRRK